MSPSPPNPVAAESLMANKAKEYLHLFAEGGPPFFAFLLFLSLFIYVSVFNLSLSTLFNNTKFWFCISNTLIFIIAADCGAFSPPKQKLLDDSHGGDSRRNNAVKISRIPKKEDEAVIVRERERQEKKLQIVIREPDYQADKRSEDIPRPQKKPGEETTKTPEKTYRRSKSEKGKRVMEKENKMTMRRSKTMKKLYEATEEEEKEFAEMTDEELNRRVEEFIERFNRQIRLQGIEHGDGA